MDIYSQFFGQSSIKQLEPNQVHTLVTRAPMPYLLEVRTPDEYRQAHISGAELIPLDELPKKTTQIPKEQEIICICASGSRSSVAASHLSTMGYKVSNMRGGMDRWIRAGLPVATGMSK